MELKERRTQGRVPAGHGKAGAIALFTIFLLVGRAAAQPLVIQPGQDGFVTPPGSTAHLPNIPAGFFGSVAGNPSDAIPSMDISVISGPNLVSLPVVTTFLTGPGCHDGQMFPHLHCYEQQLITLVPIYDTVVQRSGGSIPTMGGNLNVSIQLVHLSLKSASPLEVHFGPSFSSFFDILVELDGAQDVGALALQRNSISSGTMDTNLPVQYKVTFDEVGGPGFFQVGGLQDTMQSQGRTWQVVDRVPTVSEWGLVVMALIGLALGTVFYSRRRGARA